MGWQGHAGGQRVPEREKEKEREREREKKREGEFGAVAGRAPLATDRATWWATTLS